MLNIDFDGAYKRSRLEKQMVLYNLPRPFFVRLSSSLRGFHIRVPGCKEWDWPRCYDDPMRIDLDSQREHKRLPLKNLVFDVKHGARAGSWWMINSEREIEGFLDAHRNDKVYLSLPRMSRYANVDKEKTKKDAPARAARLGEVPRLQKTFCQYWQFQGSPALC